MQQWIVLACAVAALALGLPLALVNGRRLVLPRPRYRVVLAWLIVALCPVFLIFLFFPDSSVEGEFPWGVASGAFAAFFVVWSTGAWFALRADGLDAREMELERRHNELTATAPSGGVLPEHEPLTSGDIEFYDLMHRRGRSVALVPGGFDNVRFVDAWVSSENTNMQMARFYDGSVSGTVRYLGGRRNDRDEVVEDLIGSALESQMDGRRLVDVGMVFDTDPGRLAETHHVKRLLHVAAVVGQFGKGYRAADDIGACARNVLEFAERLGLRHGTIRSLLLPLLGAGTGRGDIERIVPAVLDAVVDHLESRPDGRITTICVIVHTPSQRARCRKFLDADERLGRPPRLVKRGALRASD